MHPSPPKLNVQMNPPRTPQTTQTTWGSHIPDAPYLSSPSSPESLASPISPSVVWPSLDRHVQVVGSESPRALLKVRQSLSRQPSVKIQPVKVGELTLDIQIGSGAFSKTYQAYGSHGVYAVKTRISCTNPAIFITEQRILTKLANASNYEHENVVRFYPELSEIDHLVFRRYETSLESLVTSPKFKPNIDDFDFFDFKNTTKPLVGLDTWKNWAGQLINGMRFIHSQNIIHADFKPDNVLVINDQLVIADFSGAIDLDYEGETGLGSELTVGLACSPVYTDPEVRSERCNPSKGSDIYSLGLVLVFCATGKEPYSSARNATQRIMWMNKMEPLDSYEMEEQSRLKHVNPTIRKCLTRTLEGIDVILQRMLD